MNFVNKIIGYVNFLDDNAVYKKIFEILDKPSDKCDRTIQAIFERSFYKRYIDIAEYGPAAVQEKISKILNKKYTSY